MSDYIQLNVDGPLTENNILQNDFTFSVEIKFYTEKNPTAKKIFSCTNTIPKQIKIDDVFKDNEQQFHFGLTYKLISNVVKNKSVGLDKDKNINKNKNKDKDKDKDKNTEKSIIHINKSHALTFTLSLNENHRDFKNLESSRYIKSVLNPDDPDETILLDIPSFVINKKFTPPSIKMTSVSDSQLSHFSSMNYLKKFINNINDYNENNIKKSIDEKNKFIDVINIQNISDSSCSVLWNLKRYPIYKYQYMWQKEEQLLEF